MMVVHQCMVLDSHTCVTQSECTILFECNGPLSCNALRIIWCNTDVLLQDAFVTCDFSILFHCNAVPFLVHIVNESVLSQC